MNLREAGEWHDRQKWQSQFPYLEDATLRLVYPYLDKAYTRLVLSTAFEYLPDDIREDYFTPPASPEGKTVMILADLTIALLHPEKIIPGLIKKAIDEIDEAYRVILEKGGGWSSNASKSTPDKRQLAVLDWYRRNQAKLSYLKKSYLEDNNLYEDRGGQEKRQFKTILLIKIVKQVTKNKLTFSKVKDHLENITNHKIPVF